jgi:hypothetical protein
MMTVLDPVVLADEANSLCAQVQAVEEALFDALLRCLSRPIPTLTLSSQRSDGEN